MKRPSGDFGWREETRAPLRALGLRHLRVGAFVEFLKVKGPEPERGSLHPPTLEPFQDLEVRYPPPDRFADA